METVEKVLPKICAVRIDETECWTDDVRAKVDKVYGIYLVDLNCHTYCCSMTPSYAMYYIGFSIQSNKTSMFDKMDEIEELEMEMMANSSPELVCYMNCSDVDRMDKSNFDFDFTVDHDYYNFDDPKEYHEMIDDMIESYNGNPTF